MQSPEPFDYEARYGAPKGVKWPAVAIVVAILGIGWLMWTALYHYNPPLRSQLVSFTIQNDREATVRYFIERTDSQKAVVCTLIACFAPLGQYENFLLLIGSVFAPLFGVVLVDHFILRKRSAQVASAALRWPALLAWLGGVSTYHLLANLYPDVGATLPALVLAGLLQLVLGRAFSYGRETARA